MNEKAKKQLFEELKNEFECATDINDYSSLKYEVTVNEDYDYSDEIVCDVKIINDQNVNNIKNKTIYLTISNNIERKTKVLLDEDVWVEWSSYDSNVKALWTKLFFEAFFN